jgi:hypothetical protein|tara:strand:- start:523 stop:1227 length:705 start_codon:yes stop_codon:yes gene_type:complete
MIDAVRNTVLAILNKNNYGYLSPSDFNLYAQQAQLEIFEDYFYQYNTQINLENARRSGTDYANLSKGILEVIDLFSKTATLAQTASADNTYTMPADYYLMNTVIYNGLEVERVNQSKITMLLNSMITAPSKEFPAYTTEGSIMTVYPITITGATDISSQYVRYPLPPKWTYNSALVSQGPVFNPSAADYQDFELPLDNLNDLVIKICLYAGVEIREASVVQFAQVEEQQNNTQQ